MTGILRRIRGIIGTGITWAFGWAGVLVAVHLIGGFSLQYIGQTVFAGLVWGFVAGGGFGLVLSIAERRHTLGDLSLWRVALWGGMGGSILFLLTLLLVALAGSPTSGVMGAFVITVLLGAGFASGSVALAKRADTKLIEGDEAERSLRRGSSLMEGRREER